MSVFKVGDKVLVKTTGEYGTLVKIEHDGGFPPYIVQINNVVFEFWGDEIRAQP